MGPARKIATQQGAHVLAHATKNQYCTIERLGSCTNGAGIKGPNLISWDCMQPGTLCKCHNQPKVCSKHIPGFATLLWG